MGRIPDEIIQQVRDRIDIVDLVGRFVSLRRSGRSHKGLCPFHHEKTPSFNVNSDRQSYYCFGCHEGGNAFGFLMRMENLTFPEAVRSLAADCGIEVPETGSGERGLSEKLRAANEVAQTAYRAALTQAGCAGAAYLAERGLDAAEIERFGLGFAPDRWDYLASLLGQRGIPAELAERAGLLAPRASGGHYDRLRGRVTFPIRDVRGQVIGFAGRALEAQQEPKYLNTPESPIFRKREAFYGMPAALEPIRRTGRAVVVEGYFDLIALRRAGVEGCLATCGTALTEDHARGLRRRTREVVLLFDGDEAGQRASERSLAVLLPQGLRVRAALLPSGDDPDTYLAREGADALRARVEEAQPAIEIAIGRAVSGGCSTPWEKADAVAAVAPLLALVPDRVERGALCEQLALAVGAQPADVAASVRAAARGGDAAAEVPVAPRVRGADERKLEGLLRCLLDHPALMAGVPREELLELVDAGPLRELLQVLLGAGPTADGRGHDVAELGEGLDAQARAILHEIAADEGERDRQAAARTLADTLSWLRVRQQRRRQLEITRKMRGEDADAFELLMEKQRQLEERRSTNLSPMGSQS